MKILAIDTSTEACSAALLVNDDIISRFELAPRRHNQLILKMAESLLNEAGVTLKQLDGLAFGRGPGSFTGVRISTGIIQGMALGLDLPVAPVSTLASMAHRAFREFGAHNVLTAIDARMQEVYWSVFDVPQSGCIQTSVSEYVCAPDKVALGGMQADLPWVAVGTGWEGYRDDLCHALSVSPTAIHTDFFPHSHDIAILGQGMFDDGAAVPAEYAMPIYLRNEVAQKSR